MALVASEVVVLERTTTAAWCVFAPSGAVPVTDPSGGSDNSKGSCVSTADALCRWLVGHVAARAWRAGHEPERAPVAARPAQGSGACRNVRPAGVAVGFVAVCHGV